VCVCVCVCARARARAYEHVAAQCAAANPGLLRDECDARRRRLRPLERAVEQSHLAEYAAYKCCLATPNLCASVMYATQRAAQRTGPTTASSERRGTVSEMLCNTGCENK
jgi:hypothetical protein